MVFLHVMDVIFRGDLLLMELNATTDTVVDECPHLSKLVYQQFPSIVYRLLPHCPRYKMLERIHYHLRAILSTVGRANQLLKVSGCVD